MPKIHETVFTYIERIAKTQKRMQGPIVLSSDVKIATLKDGDIEKIPIAWPLFTGYNMFYVVKVPANTRVARHSHEEDVFRFVVKGSLVINDDIKVREGMWFVIRANTPYEIKSKTGYIVIAAYGKQCVTANREGTHTVVQRSARSKK
jgi:hypothetical protein